MAPPSLFLRLSLFSFHDHSLHSLTCSSQIRGGKLWWLRCPSLREFNLGPIIMNGGSLISLASNAVGNFYEQPLSSFPVSRLVTTPTGVVLQGLPGVLELPKLCLTHRQCLTFWRFIFIVALSQSAFTFFSQGKNRSTLNFSSYAHFRYLGIASHSSISFLLPPMSIPDEVNCVDHHFRSNRRLHVIAF